MPRRLLGKQKSYARAEYRVKREQLLATGCSSLPIRKSQVMFLLTGDMAGKQRCLNIGASRIGNCNCAS